MDFSEIEELLDRDKKSSAPCAKKERYIELMVEVLNEQGFSGKSTDYLRRGLSYAGARPIVKYLSGLDKHVAEEKISKLFKCDLFKSRDRVTGFRMCSSLIGFALEEFDINRRILKECIMTMPSTSKNKHGELLADAPKIVENYTIGLVSEDTNFPDLNSLGIQDIFLNEFKSMMVSILEKIQQGTNTQGSSTKIEKFMAWVNPAKQKEVPCAAVKVIADQNLEGVDSSSDGKSETLKKSNAGKDSPTNAEITVETREMVSEENMPAPTVETQQLDQCETAADMLEKDKEPEADSDDIRNKDAKADILPVKKATITESVEMTQVAALLVNLAESMNAWASRMEEISRLNSVLSKNNDELFQKIGQLQTELARVKNAYLVAQTDIESGTKIISDLRAQLFDAKRGNTELQVQSTATHEEIERLKSILSVYSADKENAQREQLNSIAAKLRAEYRDFKDAENDEMSIDLGENFRFQLAQVFKILIKAGIDVEKR